MGSLFLLFALVFEAPAFIAARYAVIRSAGATSFRQGLFITRELWERASTRQKVGFLLAGPVASYFVAVTLFFIPRMAEGETKTDQTGRVDVSPDMPAAAAGVHDGDKVVRIDGQPVTTYDAIVQSVRASEGNRVTLELERDGRLLTIPVEKRDGKLGLRPHTSTEPPSFGRAASHAIVAPVLINLSAARAWLELFGGTDEVRMGGPARLVADVKAAPERSWISVFFVLGAMGAYLVPVAGLLSLLSIPRRPRGA